MTCDNRSNIEGAFAFRDAPFASHPNDRQRAYEYLGYALKNDISWQEVEKDIRDYLGSQELDKNFIDSQIKKR